MEVSGELHASTALPLGPRERALGNHWIQGSEGSRAVMDSMVKIQKGKAIPVTGLGGP
jgi:hypothetical protein